jgi:hypothetical protein
MSMIAKHRRLAEITFNSETIRELAATVSDDVVLDSDSGTTTTVIHYPDGRIKLECQGDSQAFADAINNASSYPDGVEAVTE